jgi:hypothetical protein
MPVENSGHSIRFGGAVSLKKLIRPFTDTLRQTEHSERE